LKEKYEGELKKEIKKLQRLRDQIKTWLGSGDIKDKNSLTEARKLIETKMEQFKICEKDTKTKAFSKEGLAREAKADPEDVERQEKRDWINECLEKLNDVIDSVESEMEKLSSGRGKSKNKGGLEKLDNRVKKNRWHIGRLQLILKLLDNMDMEPSALDSIKDDVEYYIESAVDDDGALGIDDEFDIYEELDLGIQDGAIGGDSNEGSPRGDTEGTFKAGGGGLTEDKDDSKVKKTAAKTQQETNPMALIGKATTKKDAPSLPVGKAAKAAEKATAKEAKAALTTGTTGKGDKKMEKKDSEVDAGKKGAEEADSERSSESAKVEAPAPVSTAWSNDKPATQMLAQIADPPAPAAAPLAVLTQGSIPTAPAVVAPAAQAPLPMPTEPTSALETASDPVAPMSTGNSNIDSAAAIGMALGGSAIPAKPAQPMILGASTTSPAANLLQPQVGQIPSHIPLAQPGSGLVTPNNVPGTPSQSAQQLPGVDGNAGYGIPGMGGLGVPAGQMLPPVQQNKLANVSPETLAALNMLKSSMVFSPENSEIEKQPSYQPRNPYAGAHASFPMAAPTMAESGALFEKLPMDSLFFAFYYQPGTYQQYLAAKQLKKHSWRFHKKYMTWFQRHEEPKIASDEFEEGTYVYFDYESGWCQRIKSEFKFEYAFLEDELSATGST
jgi:CCR4-NOT transcription complex subunit 3